MYYPRNRKKLAQPIYEMICEYGKTHIGAAYVTHKIVQLIQNNYRRRVK